MKRFRLWLEWIVNGRDLLADALRAANRRAEDVEAWVGDIEKWLWKRDELQDAQIAKLAASLMEQESTIKLLQAQVNSFDLNYRPGVRRGVRK